MKTNHLSKVSDELKIKYGSVKATVDLLDGGSTVPFISRYRKEVTGSLDEVAITDIRDRIHQLRELDKRRDAILTSLTERELLTDELQEKINAAETLAVLEDIYLPFRPKRRTRATKAKEKGLEPLAQLIFEQNDQLDPHAEALKYVNEEMKVESPEDALAGARDIIAEWVNENTDARAAIRELFLEKSRFVAHVIKGKSEQGANYKDYFDWTESIQTSPSHRVLAVRRGEKDGILSLKVLAPEDEAISILENRFLSGTSTASAEVKTAIHDSYRRLLSLSMETEMRMLTKERADKEAITVFSQNLRELLMAAPLGSKKVMAVDPAYRTGCKVTVLNEQGEMIHSTTIFPLGSEKQITESEETLKYLADFHQLEFIAIGNGTASRETENFIRALGLPKTVNIMVVSEAGASIYSASEVAREEFPDLDVTVRGSISIGRRLMDPLAELVKIDPKSIGVGQYQHDVDQTLLRQSLDDVVVSCVNQVGVELNSASKQLLTYASGLGPTRAQAIITYRTKNGPFSNLEELYSIPRLTAKSIEQAAGFLRIHNGTNPLDASAVHPESYHIIEKMAQDLTCRVQELMHNPGTRAKIHLEKYVTDQIGMPTLQDIAEELSKPGRDPRAQFELFEFKEGIQRPEDLKPGMKLPGIVTNVTKFGAFVDIGVHLDGLVHLSQLSDKYVEDVSKVVKMHQKVHVTVLEVDLDRKRIALSMRKNTGQHFGKSPKKR